MGEAVADPGFARDARILRELAACGVQAGLPGVLPAIEVLLARGRRDTAQAVLEAVVDAEAARRDGSVVPEVGRALAARLWAPAARRLVVVASQWEGECE